MMNKPLATSPSGSVVCGASPSATVPHLVTPRHHRLSDNEDNEDGSMVQKPFHIRTQALLGAMKLHTKANNEKGNKGRKGKGKKGGLMGKLQAGAPTFNTSRRRIVVVKCEVASLCAKLPLINLRCRAPYSFLLRSLPPPPPPRNVSERKGNETGGRMLA
jgi:hypothetical protein